MHVLQRRAVVVADGKFMLHLREETVVQSDVPNVMADRSHQESKLFQHANDLLCLHERHVPEDSVCHIHRVHEVVVGICQVAFADLLDEHAQLLDLDIVLCEVATPWIVHEQPGRDLFLLAVVQLQDIEVPRVDDLVGQAHLFQLPLHCHRDLVAPLLLFCLQCLSISVIASFVPRSKPRRECQDPKLLELHGCFIKGVLLAGQLGQGGDLPHDALQQCHLSVHVLAKVLIIFAWLESRNR
mmetsp:Transcript_36684/g.85355  ORF Transcript_36684/g.85355 Transcript_36684/m.85355 type:complete len:241 (+) Transcript_36684:928-1650(+)